MKKLPLEKFDGLMFLDVDGVLNNPGLAIGVNLLNKAKDKNHTWDMVSFPLRDIRTCPEEVVRKNVNFDPVSLTLIQALAESFNLGIVISSTWRKGVTLDILQDMMKLGGMQVSGWRIIDKTPAIYEIGAIRGHEIDKWLKDNNCEHFIYIIIDDDSDMTEKQKKKNFVQCDGLVGFSYRDWQKSVELLKGLGLKHTLDWRDY